MQAIRRKSSGSGATSGSFNGIPVGSNTDEAEVHADRVAETVVSRSPATSEGQAGANSRSGPGAFPLSQNIRQEVEPVVGMDLSAVRVHSDSSAHTAAEGLGANAFTYGTNIWLGAGQSAENVRLMAHESAHVAQAVGAGGAAPVVRRDPVAGTAKKPDQEQYDSVSAFEQGVFNRATTRLDANMQKLEEWRSYINAQFDDVELKAQVAATETDALFSSATSRGRMDYFENWAGARSPATRAFDEGVINGKINSGCEACHESNIVWAWNAAHGAEFRNGPTTAQNLAMLADYTEQQRGFMPGATAASDAGAAPTASTPAAPPTPVDVPRPRTDLCGELPPAETPAVPTIHSPDAALALQSVSRIGPVVQPLGPQGYRILPAGIFSDLYAQTPAELRSGVMSKLNERRAKYSLLKSLIASDLVPFDELCPIVDELLPLATNDVRALVLFEIYQERVAEAILDVIMALVGAALLLLSVLFPPVALLVIGTAMALAQIGVGFRDIRRGSQWELGTGAGVYSPQQEAQAPGLVTGGLMNVGMGTIGLGMSAYGFSKLATPRPGMELVAPGSPGFRGAKFSPLADGSYIAFHPDNPNMCVVLDGDTLSFEVKINGEFQSMATARSPWGPGNPPPGSMNWNEWTASRGWNSGSVASRPPSSTSMVPTLSSGMGGKTPLALPPGPVGFQLPAPPFTPVGPLIVDLQGGDPAFAQSMVQRIPGSSAVVVESGTWQLGYQRITTINAADLEFALRLARGVPQWASPSPQYPAFDPAGAFPNVTQLVPSATIPGAYDLVEVPFALPAAGGVTVLPRRFFPALGGRFTPDSSQRLVPFDNHDVESIQATSVPELHGRADQIYLRRPFQLGRADAETTLALGQELNRMLRPGGFVEFRIIRSEELIVPQQSTAIAGQIDNSRTVIVQEADIQAFVRNGTLPPDAEQAAILQGAEQDLRKQFNPLGASRVRQIVRIYKGAAGTAAASGQQH
jgi:hypothetical protein